MSDTRNSSRFTNNVPNGYRLEPDGVLEIGTVDKPVKIPNWYRFWCKKLLGQLVLRSNGRTIKRSATAWRYAEGLILTDEERARPLAPHHYFDGDDILCFPGCPKERWLFNRIFEGIRGVLSSRLQRQIRELRGLKVPEWYKEACARQGSRTTFILRGERWILY